MDSLRENDEKDSDNNEPKDNVPILNLNDENVFFKKNSVSAQQSMAHVNEKNKNMIKNIKDEAQVQKEKLLKLGNIAGLKYCETFRKFHFIFVFSSQKGNPIDHPCIFCSLLDLWIIPL